MDLEEENLFNVQKYQNYGEKKDVVMAMIKDHGIFVTTHQQHTSRLFHKFLEFHLSVLGLETKDSTERNVRLPNAICPPNLDLFSLKPWAKHDLQLASLTFLALMFKSLKKKSIIFAWWPILLPCRPCHINPCKSSIFELVNHSDVEIRESVLNLLIETFQSSKTHLLLANAHCPSLSFTPVCLEFALALGRLIKCTLNCLYDALCDGQPSHVSHTSRTLVTLFEQVPFNRLENGLLDGAITNLQRGLDSENPVVKIAILGIFAVLPTNHPEVRSKFAQLFDWFYFLAFPNPETRQSLDNNIRYVSIQNLGLLVSLDTEQFMIKINNIQPELERCLKTDKDNSVVIHVLRLIKTFGKCGHSYIEDNPGQLESERRLLHFWLNILKPSLMDSIEARNCPVLKAALCNCIAEVGGKIFCALPTDRRMLAVTLMLRLCRDSDHRTVTSAARGIGMMVSLPTLQSDMAFLTDGAEIILELLNSKTAHHAVVTSCTWALANLSDSIAKYHCLRASKEQEQQLSSMALDEIFPPFIVLELIRKSVTYSFATNSHMNIRSNSVRSLGSLIQCLGAMTKWVQLDEFKEVEEICSNAVDAVIMNVSGGKVMKVRWNACYAAGGILRTQGVFTSNECHSLLIQALIPVIENCTNFKVRINASLSLTSVSSRVAFGEDYLRAALTIVKAMESAYQTEADVDEVQHRTELVNQLVCTYAYLLTISTSMDLPGLESQLVGYADLILSTVKSVLLRISPEKTDVFVQAKRHLTSEAMSKKDRQVELFPITFVDGLSF